MNLFHAFHDTIETVLVRFWEKPEKISLMRIIYEVYNMDGQFSDDEKDNFARYNRSLALSESEVVTYDLKTAFGVLKQNPRHMDLAYIWIANALFIDGEFSDVERKKLEALETKYDLSSEKIDHHINHIRTEKANAALKKWQSDH